MLAPDEGVERLDRVAEHLVLLQELARTKPDTATEADLRYAMRNARPSLTGRLLLFASEHHLLPEAYLYGFASTVSSSLLRSSSSMTLCRAAMGDPSTSSPSSWPRSVMKASNVSSPWSSTIWNARNAATSL